MKKRRKSVGGLLIVGLLWLSVATPEVFSAQEPQAPPTGEGEGFVLKESAICESLRSNSPVNAGVVFSTAVGRVFCVTSFTPASRRTTIFHSWFHRDQLSNRQRLSIHPRGTSALSSLQLREGEKGPWHVEISDETGRILRVLRFSVVD